MKIDRRLWLPVMVLLPGTAAAAPGLDALSMTVNADGSETYTLSLQVLLLMTLLSMLPAAMLTMTSFARIIIVLALLRQALGTMSTPTNQILVGLAFFLTLFIMAPVFERAYHEAVVPYMNEELGPQEAFANLKQPFRKFMMDQVRETDLALFSQLAGVEDDLAPDEIPFIVLAPAFLTSELKTAFQIGFLIFIPFLIIDLVVASVLMAMGMMMLSPLIISLPFKIMLFVMVDGWVLIVGTLASSFY